jgi:hypothetical protein
MDKIEYRAVINFFVKVGLTPNKIHSKFIKVYGDSSPLFPTIKKWAAHFKRLNVRRRIIFETVTTQHLGTLQRSDVQTRQKLFGRQS